MFRPGAGALIFALLASASVAGERVALAQPPADTQAEAPGRPAPAPPAVAAPHGALVVAATDEAAPAAHALALEVYRDPALRPPIDDATARVLAGEAAPANATPKLRELSEVRGSLPKAGSDVATRHLLGALATDLGAQLVVVVSAEGGHPSAKVLRAATSTFERVELGATVETPEDGARVVKWPGASVLLLGILAPKPAALKPTPTPAPPPPAPKESKPFYTSPWFWGSLAGVAAVGVTVFVLSKTSDGGGNAHLTGQVGP